MKTEKDATLINVNLWFVNRHDILLTRMFLQGLLILGTSLPTLANTFAYVSNRDNNTVSVIDLSADPGTVVKTIGVAVIPDGESIYVAVASTNPSYDSVLEIDIATNTIIDTIPGLCISPDNKYAYVASFPYSTVSVIDLAENKIVKTLWAGLEPFLVAFNPDESRAYVTDIATASVKVIDTCIFSPINSTASTT